MRFLVSATAVVLAAWLAGAAPSARSGPNDRPPAAAAGAPPADNPAVPEPGPEDGGLRLRLIVTPRAGGRRSPRRRGAGRRERVDVGGVSPGA